MKACIWCGAPVGDEDWEYLGHGRAWVCGLAECLKAVRDEQRAIEENAMLDALEDRTERYW